jgi:hypothetical protein
MDMIAEFDMDQSDTINFDGFLGVKVSPSLSCCGI